MSLKKKKSSPLIIPKTDVQKLLDKQIKLLNSLDQDKFIDLESEINSQEPIENENELIKFFSLLIGKEKYKPSKEEINRIGKIHIPSKTKSLHKCLSQYDHVIEKGDQFNKRYQVFKNDKKYYVSTQELDNNYFRNKNDFDSYLESIELSKRASKLGLTVRIHDIFLCRDNDGSIRVFLVNEHVEGETLKKWLLKNQLSTTDKDKIKKLIDKFFENKIIPDYISKNDIIVLKNRKFIFGPLLNYSSTDNLINEKKQFILDDLDWINNMSEKKVSNLALKILIRDKKLRLS